MKITADKNKCCGHARCASVEETLFPLDDNGYIALTEMPVPAGMETAARRGVRACPERALTLAEDDGALLSVEPSSRSSSRAAASKPSTR